MSGIILTLSIKNPLLVNINACATVDRKPRPPVPRLLHRTSRQQELLLLWTTDCYIFHGINWDHFQNIWLGVSDRPEKRTFDFRRQRPPRNQDLLYNFPAHMTTVVDLSQQPHVLKKTGRWVELGSDYFVTYPLVVKIFNSVVWLPLKCS